MQRKGANRTLKQRLIIFTTILLMIASAAIGISSYLVAREALIEKGMISLKNGVYAALQLIDELQVQVHQGTLLEADAKARAKLLLMGPKNPDGTRDNVNPQDFGPHGYYIIYDQAGYEVMHPTLEGKNVINFVDKDPANPGFYLVRDKIAKALAGGGYTTYTWNYPYSERLGKKVVFSMLDPQWGWVVTAGSYLSDFDRAALYILQITGLTVIFVVILGYYTTKHFVLKVTTPISRVVAGLHKAEHEIYEAIEAAGDNQEVRDLTHGFNSLVRSMKSARRDIVQKDDQLYRLAYYDQLSGLPNGHLFKVQVTQHLKDLNVPSAMLLVDIKDFNLINSVHGTDYGDLIIQQIGKSLSQVACTDGLMAKVGANAFAFWIEAVSPQALQAEIGQAMDCLKSQLLEANMQHHLEFYQGVVYVTPDQAWDFEVLYQRVHTALEYCKKHKILTLVPYQATMSEAFERESMLLKCAEKAIEDHHFTVVFQSKYDTHMKRVVGVEVLARWHHQDHGTISPDEFIPILHHGNLMLAFSLSILDQALTAMPKLRKLYGKEISLSINIPPSLLFDSSFIEGLKTQLHYHKVAPKYLYLEMTEDIFIADFTQIETQLKAIQALGVKLSLDDFGTGYSSLNYLAQMQFDEIKIDKSFVQPITTSKNALALFNAIVAIAKALGCQIVAEGVEDQAQLSLLKTSGCRLVQGYVYARPESLETLCKVHK